MDTATTFDWQGVRLPIWQFQYWSELEKFLDELCPDDYVATIKYELHDRNITGIVFNQDAQATGQAVACYRITDPEPE